MSSHYFIGIDVGSSSVRAGLFDQNGISIYVSVTDIKKRTPITDFVEQSSENIVQAVYLCIKDIVKHSKIPSSKIQALAFDATCSLVCIDKNNNPVSVNEDGNNDWNIIMWMDHRAKVETQEINSLGHEVLNYVGSAMSVEMQIPKIKWIKRNLLKQYAKIDKFFDLADFLQYAFCASEIRSLCTVTCKWSFLAHQNTWCKDFFEQCDLSELLEENRMGVEFLLPGEKAGTISKELATELGLSNDTVVSVGIIDAHAGVLGASGGSIKNKMIIIGGTSNCHMYNSKNKYFIEGVWGPYCNVIGSTYWLNEGGQSAAGALIDYTIRNHISYLKIKDSIKEKSIYEFLNNRVTEMKAINPYITEHVHVLDYHHGNRSPRANSELRGMVSGLSLNEDIDSLAIVYLATIQSVCYGTRHIIDTFLREGALIEKISVCGGILKNPLWVQELADVCQVPLEITKENESMMLGSAMLAAKASGMYTTIEEAMNYMSKKSHEVFPNLMLKDFHNKKYKVYLQMYEDQMKYKEIMST